MGTALPWRWHAMSHDKLAYMANQIGQFFQSQKQDQAVAAIEDHLLTFWDPRMRRLIMTELAEGRIELDPLVRDAVLKMAARTAV
jgi:formate dehydrogenase subunit delta